MEEAQLSSVLQNFFDPSFLASFRKPFDSVAPVVYLHTSETDEPEEIGLGELFPFMTIQDIKTYIYNLKGKEEEYHPYFQSLLVPFTDEPSAQRTEFYIPLDFAFVNMDKKGRILSTFQLPDPFQQMKGSADSRFVDTNGERRNLKVQDRSNTTMEDLFPELFGSKQPVLHLFLFRDVARSASEQLLTSKQGWNGHIYMYYPELPQSYGSGFLDAKEVRYLEARSSYVKKTLHTMEDIDILLQTIPLSSMTISSIKFLRLIWKKPAATVADVETLFYQIPVTYTMPFLRILPYQGVPITKLHVESSALRIPSFDPRLIKQWVEQKALSKDDFMYGKVMIRDKEGIEPALFATLRFFNDRSADFILQPPKNLKKLMLRDISQFGTYVSSALQGTYLETADVEIGEAAIICTLPTIGLSQVSKKQFLRRLKLFGSLFEEISPLEKERNVLAMLRYRAVSKYTTEDKVFTFITQYNSRKIASGDFNQETFAIEMVEAIMYAFKLRYDDAVSLFTKWTAENGKITLNVAETKDFILQYNRGIDIAVFAQQSSYSFHLYRVTSSLHLRRILTSLSILLSVDDETIEYFLHDSLGLQEAVSVVDEEEAEEAKKDAVDQDFTAQANASAALGFMGEEYNDEDFEEPNPLPREPEGKEPMVVAKAKPVLKSAPKPVENISKAKSFREYFTTKLYDIDEELFPKTLDDKGKEVQTYSVKCQSTKDRQPNALTEEQYEAMLEMYKDDDVTFLEFPLRDGDKPVASGEVIPVLKYGSSSYKMNYFVCCKYFCTRDYIMILEKDFAGTHYRPERYDEAGEELLKQPNTCPFCEAKVITNKKNPGLNEWVYKRMDDNNRYVGLLGRTEHPRGIFQPCCFGSMPKYRVSNPQFQHLQYSTPVEDEDDEEERETTVTMTGTLGAPISYSVTLSKTYKKFIVEKNKFPLDTSDQGGPQIGLLLPILDPYFQQDDESIVHNPSQKKELKPNSRAFLRVGVNNTFAGKPESFFSAIAPFLSRNSADEVRRMIKERIDPRNFMFFNYGNLLLEFYNPSDAGPTDSALRHWSQTQRTLQVDLTSGNKDALLRLWKSYHRFLAFLDNKTLLKEYRQFAQLLALPGFLSPRGIVFIVLDIVKEGDIEKLEVRCPPYGYDHEMYADADIGFLLHHYSGSWEPIFYSENETAHRQFGDRHEVVLNFQRALSHTWPSIIQSRVYEFTQKCSGPGRAAWTSGTGVDSFALIPIARAIQGIAQTPEGVIRDAYNHIVALTYRYEAGKTKLVALPVVDDGTIITPANIHFDWDDYTPASLDQVVKFYQENVEPFFTYYQGYSVRRGIREISTSKIVAVQLKNGLYIPCTPIKTDMNEGTRRLLADLRVAEIDSVDHLEWSINRDIIFGKKDTDQSKFIMKSNEEELNETFEYLRLSFANWFASEEVSDTLRKEIEGILYAPGLPLFEKRKRLEIKLGKLLLSWMDTTEEFTEEKSLLRVDCRFATGKPEAKCPGRCVWKASESKCLLHVPTDENEVFKDVPSTLMRRLFEELIRFPERRKQLLEKRVSPLVSLKQALLIDNQYILPQSSLAWYDLMREDWTGAVSETKKFYEEMSDVTGNVGIAPPSTENSKAGALPNSLSELLGIESEKYYIYRPEVKEAVTPSILPFLVSMGTFPSEIGLGDEDYQLTEDSIRQLVLQTRRPVLQFIVSGDEMPSYMMFGPAKKQKDPTPMILVIMDIDQGGPGMLSLSPTAPIPIPEEKMSFGLKFLYEERTLVSEK